ncbi:imelysin family protein [Halopseudomonas sp.]|jgi:predicted lipoprotein|uniref:imelysin family protein n=1 Tax=Halopseudomonas sp. TaxID=2901191 RepID=UPI0039E36CF9
MSVLSNRPGQLLASACLLSLMYTSSAYAESAREQWHAQLSNGYIALADASSDLHQQAAEHCAISQEAAVAPLRDDWLRAFLAWQRVRFIDFGPIEHNSMAWQFQFWPDSKNLIARQVDGWMKDQRPVSTQALAGESVALKGFPAMEYLLYGEQSDTVSPRGCELLVAISAQASANATHLVEQWAAFKPHYLESDSYQTTTISAAMHALEIMRDARLGAPMGLQGKKRRNPYLADAWRSEQSLTAIQATLQGLQSEFLPGFATVMRDAGKEQLLTQFEETLGNTLERIDSLPSDVSASLKDEQLYRGLQLLFVDIDRLASLLNGPIASELGIIKGFNSSDGD